ncbi:hypothetical protein N007_15215 [Alicyclobacillus acidoterrestris ATCC 49025]|nr:hypothetical protein N007_15215 [Alicyclobacillus acidoterrestris ATCC 49025]
MTQGGGDIVLSQEKLTRLNQLAHKAKRGALTDDERSERDILRREYLDNFRAQFRGHLERIHLVDGEDETNTKPQ